MEEFETIAWAAPNGTNGRLHAIAGAIGPRGIRATMHKMRAMCGTRSAAGWAVNTDPDAPQCSICQTYAAQVWLSHLKTKTPTPTATPDP